MSDASQLGRCFGVLGDPVAHSRSPAMHQAAFAVLGLPHSYHAFHVRPPALGAALRGAGALGLGGLNITVPHKKNTVAHMDRLDASAQRIDAVNTVVFEDGATVGYSTDGAGFLDAVAELGTGDPTKAVVLGGGGAARSIVDALMHHDRPPTVTWVSRTPRGLPAGLATDVAGYGDLDAAFDGADLLVNATTVGMQGGPQQFPTTLPLHRLAHGAAAVDIVYPRVLGGWLDEAERHGARVQDGLPMLLWQGVRSLALWLGRDIPPAAVQAMRRAITDGP